MAKLTDRFLAALRLEPGRKDRLVFDDACPGLGVRVTGAGTRSFLVQWTDPATKRKVREPLGVWGAITLEQARAAARARLGAVARGIDPKAERARRRAEAEAARARAEREKREAAFTFEKLVADWEALHLAHRRPRYRDEAARAIRFGLAELLKLPAARITKADAVAALDRIAKAHPVTARRTMAYARAAFRWAQQRGRVADNPFQGLPLAAVKSERERVLNDAEIAELWTAAGTQPYPWGPFFRMLLLTLQRREEVAGMRWSEIAEDLSVWTIPGDRMKNGKPHAVHLSAPARAILRAMPRLDGCDFVFSTGRRRRPAPGDDGPVPISGISKAKAALDEAMREARAKAAQEARRAPAAWAPWRLHDLRRTGVSVLARLGFDSIVADKILAHRPARLQGVAGIYQRYEFAREQAQALDAWAAHVTGTGGRNVVTLARRQRSS